METTGARTASAPLGENAERLRLYVEWVGARARRACRLAAAGWSDAAQAPSGPAAPLVPLGIERGDLSDLDDVLTTELALLSNDDEPERP
jgi:hypothetical protein